MTIITTAFVGVGEGCRSMNAINYSSVRLFMVVKSHQLCLIAIQFLFRFAEFRIVSQLFGINKKVGKNVEETGNWARTSQSHHGRQRRCWKISLDTSIHV